MAADFTLGMVFSAAVLASSAPLRMASWRESKAGLPGCGRGLACALVVSPVTQLLSRCSFCGLAVLSIIRISGLLPSSLLSQLYSWTNTIRPVQRRGNIVIQMSLNMRVIARMQHNHRAGLVFHRWI